MRRRLLTVAAPAAVFLCHLPGTGPTAPVPVSIGGGPTGGVQATASTATPTDYGDCGSGTVRETGLQGQVSKAEQDSGRSKEGARCNLRLVGYNDIRARGANLQLGWHKRCAYVGSIGTRDLQTAQGTIGSDGLDGVAVIDASNESKPELVQFLRAPEGTSQHEAVEVNERRGMLVVETGGLSARYVDVYDVSKDCRNPIFKGRYDAGEYVFHGLRISPDGNTIYATDYRVPPASSPTGVVQVIDVSDMSHPKLVRRWSPPGNHLGVHDLDVSPDGRRAYLGVADLSAVRGSSFFGGSYNTGPSMLVVDTSDIQDRKPNPAIKVVGEIGMTNWGHTEKLGKIGGKPYLFSSGETPWSGARNCPWAWGHIVDMSDERRPRAVAEIKLAVNEQSNCPEVGRDGTIYSTHYIGVDDPDDTTMVFYTYYAGGVRVFDVRDPAHPREIAYFHPSPMPDTVHKPYPRGAGDYQDPAADSALSDIRYFPDRRRLWFTSLGRGFQILQLERTALERGGRP